MVADVLQSNMNGEPGEAPAEEPAKMQRSESDAGLQTTFEASLLTSCCIVVIPVLQVAACDGLDTVSVLALPLKNCLEHLVGVLEIRNKVMFLLVLT